MLLFCDVRINKTQQDDIPLEKIYNRLAKYIRVTPQCAAFHGASVNPASLSTTFFSASGCPRYTYLNNHGVSAVESKFILCEMKLLEEQ
jgi:hypothetical protein